MSSQSMKIDDRVEVTGKHLTGTVKYVGTTLFATGKWIGVELDEAKGKNDGTVQGRQYFVCPENHGIFVRQSQLSVLSNINQESSTAKETPRKTISSSLPKPSFGRPSPPKEKLQEDRTESEKVVPTVSKIGKLTPLASSPNELKTKLASGLQRPSTTRSTLGTKVASGIQSPSKSGVKSGLKAPGSSQTPSTLRIKPSAQVPSSEQVSSTQQQEKKPEVEQSNNSSGVSMRDVVELQHQCTEKDRKILDLEEKFATIKQKRLEDKAKLKEYEKTKLQLNQLLTYRTKWQESQKDLQAQLKAAKKELQEMKEAHDEQPDDLATLQEAVEMATLDKEMAEEKLESIVQENESLKEKVEELSLELEILKSEVSDGGIEGAANNAEIKTLTEQNNKLKEAVVSFRELVQSEKYEQQRLKKQFNDLNNTLTALQSEKEKLNEQLSASDATVDELKEQVDIAIGAEEMVETLTDKNLELGEKIKSLQETIEELEALQDLNEQLEETHNQNEIEMREEIEMKENSIRELERKVDAAHGSIVDHQKTIEKFRELVSELQNTIVGLQEQSGVSNEEKKSVLTPSIPDIINLKFQAAETKSRAKMMSSELEKFELQQCKEQLKMIESFLPESFMKRGGDAEGIFLSLLMPRLQFKSQFLQREINEKFSIAASVEDSEIVNKNDQINFAAFMNFSLCVFESLVKRFERGLSECSTTAFDRITSTYNELASHEKCLDDLINVLKKGQFDDNVVMGPLKKAITNYDMMVRFHISHETSSSSQFLQDQLQIFNCGADTVSIGLTKFKQLCGKNCEEGSELRSLFSDIELRNMEIRQLSRKIKRAIPQESSSELAVPKEVQNLLLDSLKTFEKIVQFVNEYIGTILEKTAILPENESLLSGQLEEMSQDITILVFENENDSAKDCLSLAFNNVISQLSSFFIKMQEGEYDCKVSEKKKNELPYVTRAKALRHELAESGSVEEKLAAKDKELQDARIALKIKAEEVSQANIRVGLLEKRLDNSTKEADSRVEQINKKLQQAVTDLEKQSREYEETYDALQSDIDHLEKEKVDLKKKLDALSKKSLLQDLARQTSGIGAVVAAGAAGKTGTNRTSAASSGEPVQVIIKDSPVLLRQMESLKIALNYVKNENVRLKSDKLKARLRALPQLFVPPKLASSIKNVTSTKRAQTLTKIAEYSEKIQSLLDEINLLIATPYLVDLTKTKAARNKFEEVNRLKKLKDLTEKKDNLQQEVYKLMASTCAGANIQTDFSSFISPTFSKALQEKINPVFFGKISIPDTIEKGKVYPITLRPNEFRKIHETFLC